MELLLSVISTLLSVISTAAERSRAARRDSLRATDTCALEILTCMLPEI
jgi:hypothetical protein